MAPSPALADTVLAAVQAKMGWVSLHTADPTGGLNEVTMAPYARQVVTWGIPSGGLMSNSAAITIPLPAGVAVYYLGLWDAVTGGNYQDGALLSTSDGIGLVLIDVGSVVLPVGSISVLVGP
jgi:hypothetical protein